MPEEYEYVEVPAGQGIPQQPGMQQGQELQADLIQEERIANIIEQINPENFLEEIEYRIKGYKKDRKTKEWIKINQKGVEIPPILVERFMSFISSLLNQNTTLSNFSETEINRLMKMVIEYVSDDLSTHSEEYGLKSDYIERTRIGMIMLNVIFTVLKRSLNGTESRRIFGSLRVSETLTKSPTASSGALDFLKFWK